MNDTPRNNHSTAADPLDALRSEWQTMSADLSHKLDRQTSLLEEMVTRQPVPSLKRKLLRATLLPNAAGFMGILVVQIYAKTHPLLMLTSVGFFLLMIAMRCINAYRINRLDPYSDTIKDTLHRIMSIERFHTIGVIIGLALAAPILVWMLTVMSNDYGPAALYGGIAGMIFGGILGYMICSRSRRLIRQLTEQLKDS